MPLTLASCLLVVVLSWWLSTRSRDFLSPPDPDHLQQVRVKAATMNPTAGGLGDALSPANQRAGSKRPVPVVLPRHIQSQPQLDDYLDEANHGAEYLSGLARLLKSSGHPERSRLCWERVLDSCKADESQRRLAITEIRELRKNAPEWQVEAGSRLPIILRAGTGPTAAAQLRPVLQQWAKTTEAISGQLLEVRSDVAAGNEDLGEGEDSPVAMWITGPGDDAPSTDVVSFPLGKPEQLSAMVGSQLHRILKLQLAAQGKLQAPATLNPGARPQDVLHDGVTRLSWREFGLSLQPGS